jgi:hypothetical protein
MYRLRRNSLSLRHATTGYLVPPTNVWMFQVPPCSVVSHNVAVPIIKGRPSKVIISGWPVSCQAPEGCPVQSLVWFGHLQRTVCGLAVPGQCMSTLLHTQHMPLQMLKPLRERTLKIIAPMPKPSLHVIPGTNPGNSHHRHLKWTQAVWIFSKPAAIASLD